MTLRFRLLLLFVFGVTLLTVRSEQVTYRRIGDEVVLKPPSPPKPPVSRLFWKHNDNLAVEWDGNELEQFSLFKDRGFLNISTGELTIKALTEELSGDYRVVVNGDLLSGSIALKVISPVPTPHISESCDEGRSRCTLTCDGDVSGMDPKPTYIWKFNLTEQPASSNTFHVTPETSAAEFICELKNPVSHESSRPHPDPFTDVTPGNDLKILKGVIVCACLVAVVLAVVVVHRVKSGMWFYQKDSLPWETDFWSKTERASGPQQENENPERNAMMESNS